MSPIRCVQVGDYESARKYLQGYLAEKDSHVIAHKLSGKQHFGMKLRLICQVVCHITVRTCAGF